MNAKNTKCQANQPSICRYHGSPFASQSPEEILTQIGTVQASLQHDLEILQKLKPPRTKPTQTVINFEAGITGHKNKIQQLETAYNLTKEGYQQLQNRVKGFEHHPAATAERLEQEKAKLKMIEHLSAIKISAETIFQEERENIRKDDSLSKEQKKIDIKKVERSLIYRLSSSKVASQQQLTKEATKNDISLESYIAQLNVQTNGYEHLITQAEAWVNR